MCSRKLLILSAAIVGFSTQVFAQNINIWKEQGAGPILKDSNTVLPNNSPVAGAINAIVPSPTSPDVVFVGTVSGGVWKTSNATDAAPTWIPLTDNQLRDLPIKSLAMSPVNSDFLFAGTGSTSAFGPVPSESGVDSNGFRGIGVARSTDGGDSWTLLASNTFTGRVITSIVPTRLNGGATVLASTWPDGGGVYRSTDLGDTFSRISAGASGLPDAGVTSLIADSSNPNRFYAGVPGAPTIGGSPGAGQEGGVYRSDDGGVTWSRTGLVGLPGLSMSQRILLAVSNGVVYADVITKGVLAGVFRSDNAGLSWTNLGTPTPPIYAAGDTEGGQGGIHGAIAADPSNPNVVFISGDRQDLPFPNVNGCDEYSGNVFRYTGVAWENVVCNGALGTSPHADSRFMTFDVAHNLLQANDGGIARLQRPNVPGRSWVSAVGNIRSAEFHSVAYDPLSKILFAGAQDNGASYQTVPGGFSWSQLVTGDGGVVGVDAKSRASLGQSIRYTASQNWFGFNRTIWTSANAMVGAEQLVGLNITAGTGTGMTLRQFEGCNLSACPFYPAFALNAINPSRMLLKSNYLYESFNQGDSLRNLGGSVGSVTGYGRPIVYGGRLSGQSLADVFYVGVENQIYHRVSAGGPILPLESYPGGVVITVATNPNNYRQVYVCDISNRVWGSWDEGASWVDLTRNLDGSTPLVTTIEAFSTDGTVGNTTLYAGGYGVFQLANPSGPGRQWTQTTGGDGSQIPPAIVADLHYDYTGNVLVAGTLGRGSWLFGPAAVVANASSQPLSISNVSVATAVQTKLPPVPPVRAAVPLTP